MEWERNARLVNITETKSNNGDLRGSVFLHSYSRRGGLGRPRENCCPECGSSRDCERVHHSRPGKEDAGGSHRMKERIQGRFPSFQGAEMLTPDSWDLKE